MNATKLAISETFLSVQGEGPYTGMPALFLRLKGCNLLCGGAGTVKSKKPEGDATWRCDTIEVWKSGSTVSINTLCKRWTENGWLDALKSGTHLIITGGEPLLQRAGIQAMLHHFESKFQFIPFVEIETNGTVPPCELANQPNCYFNVSPKLQNSGTAMEDRYHPETLRKFKHTGRTCFKFVVSSEQDINEIETLYVNPLGLTKEEVLIMPGADHREHLNQLLPNVAKWGNKHGFNICTRLHIHAWNQKTGV